MNKMGITLHFCVISLLLAIASSSSATQDTSPPASSVIPSGADCMQAKTLAMLSAEQDAFVGLTGQSSKNNITPDAVYSHRIVIADLDIATATLIDIRDAAAQTHLSIPNALSMSGDLIASRHFLRTHNLVLIGSGQDGGQLEKTATQLAEQGFSKVMWLQGGVRAWVASDRETIGTGAATLDQLSSTDFHRWKADKTLHHIWLGDPSQKPRLLSADGVVNPQLPKWKSQLQSEIDTLRQHHPKQNIIVVTKKIDWHTLYQATHQVDKMIQHPNLWWLKDGWEGYQQYTQQHVSMLAQKQVSLQRPCTAIE